MSGGNETTNSITVVHFTVVCSVTWPLNGSEAGGCFVLIQTALLLLCKSSCSSANFPLRAIPKCLNFFVEFLFYFIFFPGFLVFLVKWFSFLTFYNFPET